MNNNYHVLEARDRRVEFIEKLIDKDKLVLSLRANYPGVNKDNGITRKLIDIMHRCIIEEFEINYSKYINCGEGPVYIYTVNSKNPFNIKEKAIKLEEEHQCGRLIDLDVYYQNIKSISREDSQKTRRKCFLCGNDAFICIRNKNHTLKEITTYFKRIVEEYEE